MWGKTLEQEQANDRYKKHLAKKNGIKIYYTIDMRYSELEYMKQNIIKTLSHLFDLSEIDWGLTWEESQNSLVIKAWELWNSGITDYDYYYKRFHCNRHFVRDKLVLCSQLCLIKESEQEIYRITKINAGTKISVTKGQPIMCNETGEVYHSIEQVKRKTGINVSNYFRSNRNDKYAGQLSDGTKLTWTKLSKEQYNDIINSRAS